MPLLRKRKKEPQPSSGQGSASIPQFAQTSSKYILVALDRFRNNCEWLLLNQIITLIGQLHICHQVLNLRSVHNPGAVKDNVALVVESVIIIFEVLPTLASC